MTEPHDTIPAPPPAFEDEWFLLDVERLDDDEPEPAP